MAEAFLIIAIIWNVLVSLWNSYAAGMLWEHGKAKYERFIAGSALAAGFVGMFYSFILIFVALGYLPVQFSVYAAVFVGWMFIPLGLVFVADGIRLYKETKNKWVLFFTILNSLLTIWNLYAWIQSVRAFTQMGGIGNMMKEEKSAWMYVIISVAAALFLAYGFFTLGRKNADKVKAKGMRKARKK